MAVAGGHHGEEEIASAGPAGIDGVGPETAAGIALDEHASGPFGDPIRPQLGHGHFDPSERRISRAVSTSLK